MSDLFDNENNDVNFETLVGEGKKFKTPDDLAKAKAESDRFIEKLQNEMAELRTELKSRTTLEDLMDKMRAPVSQEPPVTTPNMEPARNATEPSEANLAELVKKMLDEEKRNSTKESNLSLVNRALKEQFGPDYKNRLSQVAEELGVGNSFLSEMAANSPEGFIKLVSQMSKAERPVTPPNSSVDPNRPTFNSTKKNNAYYQNLRRTDPNAYFSTRIQNEMYEQAKSLGEAFYQN